MKSSPKLQVLAACVALACSSLGSNVALSQARGASGNPVDQLPKVEPPQKPAVTLEVAPPAAASSLVERSIELKRISVEGVKSVNFADISAVFTPFIGKNVKISELVEAAKQVNVIYREAGYALAFSFIPEQDLSTGNLRIVVVEGYVKDVRLDGDAGGSETAIQRVAASISEERPLTTTGFQSLVALLGRIPGVTVEASVPPPTTTDGATTLVLKINRKPVTVATSLDTYRPGVRVLATVTANGLSTLGEQTTASALLSKDTSDERFYSVGEAVPIGRDGLILKLDAYHYGSNTELSLAPGVVGQDQQGGERVSFSASVPLVLALDHQLVVNAGFDLAHESDSYSGEAALYLHDQSADLRIVHVGVSASTRSASNQAAASADLYRGLTGLGASADTPSIDTDFTRVVLTLSDKLNYTEQLSSNFAMRGQFSRDRLPSSEQIGFGGAQFGLGYPTSDVVGDRGFGLSADLSRAFLVAVPGLKVIEPYIAFDTARVYSTLLPTVVPRLASAALGVRLSDGTHYNIDFALARPIAAMPTDGSGRALRFDLNFSYRSD